MECFYFINACCDLYFFVFFSVLLPCYSPSTTLGPSWLLWNANLPFRCCNNTTLSCRNSYTFGQSFAGYRSSYAGRPGSYVPLHLRQQQREAEDREKSQALLGARDRSTYCGPSSVSSPASSSSPSTTNSVFKRCVLMLLSQL